MADSYKINETIFIDEICFMSFNNNFKKFFNTNEYSVLILDKTNTFLSKKDFLFYLKIINQFVPIKFKIFYDSLNKWHEIKFIIDKNKNYKKSEMVFTTMLIRCVYEQKELDNFFHIVKHYLKLLRLKNITKIDKFKLFTIAMNIYINNNVGVYSYNSNHNLCRRKGCKIISSDIMLRDLKVIDDINSYFTLNEELEYNFKLTKKNNYKNILNDIIK